jgi:membrane associated rhomboid family serine protease
VQIKQEVTDKRTGRRGILEHAVRLDSSPRSVLSSLITTMFLHAGIAHLLGNMWFLLIFGNNVEDRLGHVPFLLFYLLGGLLATTGHWLQEPGSLTPVIGASGAVASILGAYAVTWPWARIHTLLLLGCIPLLFDFPALLVLGVWFVAQLLSARERMGIDMSGGVAFLAHVCGFVAGTVLMPMARRIIPDRSPRPAPLHYDDETPQYIDERWDPDRYS